MGGKRKIDQAERAKLLEEQAQAQKALEKKKAKQSLIIRSCAAVVVLAVAAFACYFMLTHDFNPDRDVLRGTYIAERRFVYETESGTDMTNPRIFPVVFGEDGSIIYKFEGSSQIHYYEFEEIDDGAYNGIIKQYTDGSFARDIYIIRDEKGNISMSYAYDSLSFSVPDLVFYFGEEMTFSMLSGVYDEDICRLLVAGEYDSITDEQLKKIKVERKNLPSIAFSIKNMPAVFNLTKISDEELTRRQAMAIWEELNAVSASDIVSESDAISASDAA